MGTILASLLLSTAYTRVLPVLNGAHIELEFRRV